MVDFIMTAIYASQSDVEPLVKFIPDDASTDLFDTVLENADCWVNARLSSNSLSIWTNAFDSESEETETNKPIPALLKTAAKYYAASDIILSLYNGEELPTQYDTYFNKAELMINAYIKEQTDLLADTELKNKNPCRWSKTPTYYQQKGRKR